MSELNSTHLPRLQFRNLNLDERVYYPPAKEHGRIISITPGGVDSLVHLEVIGEKSNTLWRGTMTDFYLPIAPYEPEFPRKSVAPDSDTPAKQPDIHTGFAAYLDAENIRQRKAMGALPADETTTSRHAITRNDITVVMITTDRNPSYGKQTYAKLVHVERNSPPGLRFQLFLDNEHNPMANVARALKWASEQPREWVLFLEDDLLFCDRFIDSVAVWLSEHTIMAPFQVLQSPVYLFGSVTINEYNDSLYSTPWSRLNSSWAPVPIDGFYGTQAFAIRREDAASLSTCLTNLVNFTDRDPGKYDLAMVDWCRATYPSVTHFIASIPSFVQHIGEESSIRPGEPSFTFPSFPGEEWSYVTGETMGVANNDKARASDDQTADEVFGPAGGDEHEDDAILGGEKCLHGLPDGVYCMTCDTDGSAEAYTEVVPFTDPCRPLEFTTSRRARAEDFSADWFKSIIAEMEEPLKMHRKLWEYAAIAKVYLERIALPFEDNLHERASVAVHAITARDTKDIQPIPPTVPRPRVLGFGVGHDPLPAWFAMHSAEVIATDKPAEDTIETWKSTGQHAAGKDQLRRLKATTGEEWARVTFDPLDMSEDLSGTQQFDLTFSCGSFEHIGGLSASLDFFVRQMTCLRPGGVAVHTTEYSIDHNLYDSPDLCLLRSRDIAILARRLAEQGDLLLPFDSTPGTHPADCYIDPPPYAGNIVTPDEGRLRGTDLSVGSIGPWHLNMALMRGHVTTSIALIAIRGGWNTGKKLTDGEALHVSSSGFPHSFSSSYDRAIRDRKPSILFLGDAVVSSGFAKSTHGVCDHLRSVEWNVRVIGMNYYGGMGAERYAYPIHPAFEPLSGPASPDGVTLLPRMIYDYSPDVVVIQQDPWNIPSYLAAIDQAFIGTGRSIPPIVGYLAVDGENQPGAPLNRLAAVVTWTTYGLEQLRTGGYTGPGYVVPLGVDTKTFHPMDRTEIRKEFAESVRAMPGRLADDIDPATAFIVGFAGRNQPRKRLDLLLQSFAQWVFNAGTGADIVSNTLLYLHVGPTGDAGFDLPSLVRYFGLNGRVIINSPEIGQGDSESDLCRRYNLLDVFVTCSQGEGFWLPGFEAAACGVPIIAPGHSAFSEFFDECSHLVESPFSITSAPHNGAMRTLGGLVNPKDVALAIDAAYRLNSERDRLAENGLDMVEKYTWRRTGESFERVLREVLGLDG